MYLTGTTETLKGQEGFEEILIGRSNFSFKKDTNQNDFEFSNRNCLIPGVWDHESPNMNRRIDDQSSAYHWGRDKVPPGPPGMLK